MAKLFIPHIVSSVKSSFSFVRPACSDLFNVNNRFIVGSPSNWLRDEQKKTNKQEETSEYKELLSTHKTRKAAIGRRFYSTSKSSEWNSVKYECKLCNKIFDNSARLKVHNYKIHNIIDNNMIKCHSTECKNSFTQCME